MADQGPALSSIPCSPGSGTEPFDDRPAPIAEDYLTDPLYPYEV